jgi:hypothetical protein
MESWHPNPRAQLLVPKRGSHSLQALTTRPMNRKRVLTKLFQVEASYFF